MNVINLIRSGGAKDHAAELAHDIWVCQGYVQSVILGSGGVVTQAVGCDHCDDENCTDEQACDHLEKLCASGGPDAIATQSIDAIPWQMLLNWLVQKLMELIQGYLK